MQHCQWSSIAIATTTIPSTNDINPAVVFDLANAINITIFCELERDGALTQTRWAIQRLGDEMPSQIDINDTTLSGIAGFENYFVGGQMLTGGGVLRTNLIIYTRPSIAPLTRRTSVASVDY